MKRLLSFALSIFLIAAIVSGEFTSWRLPNTTIPIDYNISIKVDSQNPYQIDEVFSGSVDIRVKVVETTKDVYLHSKFANITKVLIIDTDNKNVPVTFSLIANREMLQINSENDSLIGNKEYIIKITYISKLRKDKLGFHLSSYVNSTGQKVDIASTQFAPTEARHAFPCFDEPKFKAQFTVTVTHPKEYHALGNMGIVDVTSVDDHHTKTSFHKTPILSTYLVSFIISDLPHTTVFRPNFTQELYVKATGQHLVKTGEKFAADVLQKFMDTWTTAPLPLTTMKQVAIPNFYFSGMENFGSVFYNEQKWFYDPSVHSISKLLSLKTLLSHEMSHQWFGDMVTMEWWTHVWLNEGFATLMGYYGTEMIDPTSKIMQKYQIEVFMNAMTVDEAEGIRPMSDYVEVPELIMKYYDKIAYDKASCVIRMFESAIGKSEFKKGLDFYFGNMSYQNVGEDDLFKYLQDGIEFYRKSDINVKEKMSIWTRQRGLPVVNVTVDYKTSLVTFYQERFLESTEKDLQSIWSIPITYLTSSNATNTLHWMNNKEENLTVRNSFDWILFNVGQNGYYRVNYDEKSWEKLANHLKTNYKLIGWENRAQLVNDAFDMARKNYVENFSLVFDLLHFYRNETELSPWVVFDRHISILNSRLSGFSTYKNFENFMKFLLVDQRERVLKRGYDLPTERLARKVILKNACEFKECSLYEADVDLRTEYYCSLVRKGQVEFVINKVNKLEDLELRSEIFSGFGCSSGEARRKLLGGTLNSNYSWSVQEIKLVYGSMYKKNSDGFDDVVQYWLENTDDLVKLLTVDGFNKMVVDASKYANTEKNQNMIRALTANGAIFEPASREKVQENILKTKQWFSWHMDNIETYLKQYNGAQSKMIGAGFLFIAFIVLFVS